MKEILLLVILLPIGFFVTVLLFQLGLFVASFLFQFTCLFIGYVFSVFEVLFKKEKQK